MGGRSTSEWPGVIACCLVWVSKPISPATLGDRPQESVRKAVVPFESRMRGSPLLEPLPLPIEPVASYVEHAVVTGAKVFLRRTGGKFDQLFLGKVLA